MARPAFGRSHPRKLVRRLLPRHLRLYARVVHRVFEDWRSGICFAYGRGRPEDFPIEVCRYERRLIDYPGQEHVGQAKRRNQAILASFLTDTVIEPGETFSVWRLAPRPTARHGYGEAAAIRGGELILETGGAICLLSTVLYNVALLGGLRIVERHCHSIDSYGTARYFELGRDAAIEYGYRDLRFRNPHDFPVLLRIEASGAGLTGSLYSARAAGFSVEITTSEPEQRRLDDGNAAILVRAIRTIRYAGGNTITDKLPETLHRLPPRP